MRIGARRHRVTLQLRGVDQNSYGESVTTWNDQDTVWAAIIPASAKEYVASNELQAVVTHRVNIRYRKGLTPEMRIKYGARYFNINSILNRDERNIELDLMCTEDI